MTWRWTSTTRWKTSASCSGQALRQALGDKRGIVRYGNAYVPMDEALVQASVDLSGRPFLVFSVPVARTRVSNFDLDMLQEFFRAFAFNAEITLHVTMHYGHNLHHIAEAVFKSVGRCAGRGHADQPAHRRRAALDQGRAVRGGAMIAIVDYGRGNLGSVEKAFVRVGVPAVVTQDPRAVDEADAVVFPATAPSTTRWPAWPRWACSSRCAARSTAPAVPRHLHRATSCCSPAARSSARGAGST